MRGDPTHIFRCPAKQFFYLEDHDGDRTSSYVGQLLRVDGDQLLGLFECDFT